MRDVCLSSSRPATSGPTWSVVIQTPAESNVTPSIEGIAVVERLALAALVVQLAGGDPVQAEARREHQAPGPGLAARTRERAPASPLRRPRHQPPAPPEQRLEQQRQRERGVRRLRIGGDPEERRRDQRTPALPGEEPERHETEVEDLRRLPEQVGRHDPAEEDGQRAGRRRCAGRADAEQRVPEPQGRDQRRRVQDEQPAIGPEQADERRGDRRIDERLGVDEPRAASPVRDALQEDPLRAAGIRHAHARQVLRSELEVAVEGEAGRHRVVGRPVAPEAGSRTRAAGRRPARPAAPGPRRQPARCEQTRSLIACRPGADP